jgi:hypothetical protein
LLERRFGAHRAAPGEAVMTRSSDPWKVTVITLAIAASSALAIGAGAVLLQGDDEPEDRHVVVSRPPPAAMVEDCNRYAADARRNGGTIVRDGLIGGAVGAGVGAATGAIGEGRRGVRKGAAIGAVVGTTAGALYGLSEENRRSADARAAYSECLARNGY